MIKISVLVPVYGVEKFIERCARSLFEQTMMEGIEYIFVNDCTKDKSIELLEQIIEDYPERKPFVRIIHHEANKGLAVARNTGFDNAAGDYVCVVDSDDYTHPKMLEKLFQKAIDTNADIVTCNSLWQFEKFAIKHTIKKRYVTQEYVIDLLDRTSFAMWWGRLLKRELVEKNSIRIPEEVASFAEDISTVPRLFYLAKKIEFIDEYLYHYVQFNDLSAMKNTTRKSIDAVIFALNFLNDFFQDKGQEYINAINYNKFISRIMFMYKLRGREQQYVAKMFPEVGSKEFFQKLSLFNKLIHYLSSKHLFVLLNLILDTRLLLGKQRRLLKSLFATVKFDTKCLA